MWILARLIAMAVAYAARLLRRFRPRRVAGEHKGVPYYLRLRRQWYKKVVGFTIGMPLPGLSPFRLESEHGWDPQSLLSRWTTEFQTGDAEFDRVVYIASDHPALGEALKADPKLRRKLQHVFNGGWFEGLWYDGETLWASMKVRREPKPMDLQLMWELRAALEAASHRWQQGRDRYAWRIAAIEATAWSVVAYAVVAYAEVFGFPTPHHVYRTKLVVLGLLLAAALFGGFVAVVIAAMRGSSRTHFALREAGLVMLITLPLVGPVIISDLNRGLDGSPTQVVTREIVNRERVKHHGRKGAYYTYHLNFAGELDAPPFHLPNTMQVETNDYYVADSGDVVELHVGQGWLGMPWYREVVVR